MMGDDVERPLDRGSIGLIMEWKVRFALQRRREHRMRDGVVRMGRIAVVVLDLRMHVDPGHHE